MREQFIKASRLHFKAHIEKHRINVENLMENAVGVGEQSDEAATQHKGLGSHLMKIAEHTAKEHWNANKVLVTAGIGVRKWYKTLGYERIGPWMGKDL